MEISIKSFDEICRACLSVSHNMKSLFTKIDGENQCLLDLFVSVTILDAKTEDEFPKQVCSECELVLHKTEEFRKRCLESDNILKKVYNNLSQLDTIGTIDVDVKTKLTFGQNNDYENTEKKDFGDMNEPYSDNHEQNSIKKEYFEIGEHDDFDSEPADMLPIENDIKSKPMKSTNAKKSKVQKKTSNDSFHYKYLCESCNITFLDSKSFDSHLESHHGNEDTKKAYDCTEKIEKEEPKYQCSLCFRRCKTRKTLNKHMKLHEQTDNIRYHCDKCKRQFKYKSFLESHVMSVHMHNSFDCHLCKESFKSKERLELHVDSHTEKKNVCSVCGKAFLMLCTLKDHMRKHTGEKPYLCCTCGKGFSQKTNLAQHTRRHLGVKPFKCSTCTKSFVSKGELDAHSRKHSGAHPFVCDECGCGFTTSSALVKHRRTHTGERPYACDLCPMRFAASGTLKNHRRTHTGERPFQCSLCERAFVQRTDLIAHIRCHTGERPYVCPDCGQGFRKAAGLKQHAKVHGKELNSSL